MFLFQDWFRSLSFQFPPPVLFHSLSKTPVEDRSTSTALPSILCPACHSSIALIKGPPSFPLYLVLSQSDQCVSRARLRSTPTSPVQRICLPLRVVPRPSLPSCCRPPSALNAAEVVPHRGETAYRRDARRPRPKTHRSVEVAPAQAAGVSPSCVAQACLVLDASSRPASCPQIRPGRRRCAAPRRRRGREEVPQLPIPPPGGNRRRVRRTTSSTSLLPDQAPFRIGEASTTTPARQR